MIVCFPVDEYFTPEQQNNVRDITREIVAATLEKLDTSQNGLKKGLTTLSHV